MLEYAVCACSTNTKIICCIYGGRTQVLRTDDQQFGCESVLKEARFDREFRGRLEASLLR